MNYQIFGSEDSQDLDICFFVDEIGNIENSKNHLIELINTLVLETDKPINGNLAILKNGLVEQCFKGNNDELNNALLETYSFHHQNYSLQIKNKVYRNVDDKIQRCLRTLISYFTKTALRIESKKALKSNLQAKLMFLEQLDLSEHTDFGKQGELIEIYKSFAFQIGQTHALIKGVELFTKSSISNYLPSLSGYLNREICSVDHLQKELDHLIISIRNMK